MSDTYEIVCRIDTPYGHSFLLCMWPNEEFTWEFAIDTGGAWGIEGHKVLETEESPLAWFHCEARVLTREDSAYERVTHEWS